MSDSKKRILFVGPVDRVVWFESISPEEDGIFNAFCFSKFSECKITRAKNYFEYLKYRHKTFDLIVADMYMSYNKWRSWEEIKEEGKKSVEVISVHAILKELGVVEISKDEVLQIASDFYDFTNMPGYKRYGRRDNYRTNPYYKKIKDFENKNKYSDGIGKYIIDIIESFVLDRHVPMGWIIAQTSPNKTIVVDERCHHDGMIKLIENSKKFKRMIIHEEHQNLVRSQRDGEETEDYYERLAKYEIGLEKSSGKGSFIGMTRRSIENWDFVHWLWVNEYL